MAEKYRGSQYDDDLTVGLDAIGDESFDTGYVDLFEYTGEEESPLSRLKTIMLSIEWEITDDVLIDFNDELMSAQQIWVDDPVKLVYIQALQKISKYIYQKKSNAHHNAMKVLLAFFYDLEKIVLDTDISEKEKREILFDDVKKFERLKQQIGLGGAPSKAVAQDSDGETFVPASRKGSLETSDTNPDLYNLKAYILGIDWEITDRELSEISREVGTLQSKWASNKPHMLLLQGIDALGGYIKLMKSQSHGDSFKLLNSFYLALETVVDGNPGYQETKDLLLSEAEKFNRFKDDIAASITPEAIVEQRTRPVAEAGAPGESGFAAGLEDELDFQDTSEFEQTAIADDFGVDEGFSEEALEKVSSFFGDLEAAADDDFASLSPEDALRGVDVETEADDDSDEDSLPTLDGGIVAPALDGLEDDGPVGMAESPVSPVSLMQGVDVETEADDDSEEAPLPIAGGELAPALFAGDESDGGLFGAELEEDGDGEINRHLDDFFSDDMFSEEDDGEDPGDAHTEIGEAVAPALSGFDTDSEEDLGDDSFSDDLEGELDSLLTEDSEASDEPAVDDEKYVSLKLKVEALQTEISDANLSSIKTEIEEIKQALSDRPIEKTLTQLISAVVHNIDAASGEANDDAVELLQSVCGNLEKIRSSAVDQNRALELLSDETEKILKWQQQRLSR